ncbi:MAG TPA: type II toxin-antitoxin system RelE/ParE family toxin [Bacteroidales bacterium]|nr:type II toxin-antitoxin system RelE/ParE family toxin [Bacteroidales bacterium]
MRKVFWNKLAKADYFENIDYLLEKWTEKEAERFIDEVDEIIFILERGDVDFQKTNYKDVFRCVLQKQITLFYKIVNKGEIELLRFWNNYKNDKNLSF